MQVRPSIIHFKEVFWKKNILWRSCSLLKIWKKNFCRSGPVLKFWSKIIFLQGYPCNKNLKVKHFLQVLRSIKNLKKKSFYRSGPVLIILKKNFQVRPCIKNMKKNCLSISRLKILKKNFLYCIKILKKKKLHVRPCNKNFIYKKKIFRYGPVLSISKKFFERKIFCGGPAIY